MTANIYTKQATVECENQPEYLLESWLTWLFVIDTALKCCQHICKWKISNDL